MCSNGVINSTFFIPGSDFGASTSLVSSDEPRSSQGKEHPTCESSAMVKVGIVGARERGQLRHRLMKEVSFV